MDDRLVLPFSDDSRNVDHILTRVRIRPAVDEERGVHYHPLDPASEG